MQKATRHVWCSPPFLPLMLHVCVYLLSCSIQDLSQASAVLSPYLLLSKLVLESWRLLACTTCASNPLQPSILLLGKLNFLTVFKHLVLTPCFFIMPYQKVLPVHISPFSSFLQHWKFLVYPRSPHTTTQLDLADLNGTLYPL